MGDIQCILKLLPGMHCLVNPEILIATEVHLKRADHSQLTPAPFPFSHFGDNVWMSPDLGQDSEGFPCVVFLLILKPFFNFT